MTKKRPHFKMAKAAAASGARPLEARDIVGKGVVGVSMAAEDGDAWALDRIDFEDGSAVTLKVVHDWGADEFVGATYHPPAKP